MTAKMPAGDSRPLTPVDTGARMIQPSASYKVTSWVLMDTIAMIGSPAVRGAVATSCGAERACVAPASAVKAVSAAAAASATTAGGRQRRVATVDRALAKRLSIPCSVENAVRACVDQLSDGDFWKPPAATIDATTSLLGLPPRFGSDSFIHNGRCG